MTIVSIQEMKQVHLYKVGCIAFTQMWESFSFFGMRALLVLYLINSEGFSQQDAFILYTLYISFVQVFAAVGGYIVDRYLGYKRSVITGGLFMMLGHLLLTFTSHRLFLFLSLGSIICGSSLFRVSLHSLLGLLYEKEDAKREKGFTILYIGMNIGGLLAAVLCGIVAELYGWHIGFGLAAFGMLLSLIFFTTFCKMFDDINTNKTTSPFYYVSGSLASCLILTLLLAHFQIVQLFVLPMSILLLASIVGKLGKQIGKELMFTIGGALFLIIAFFTAEELWGSLLMIFSEEHIQRTVFGFEIPSAAVAAMNPLTIILIGPFLAKREMQTHVKLSFAFLLLSLGFFVLYLAAQLAQASVLYLLIGLSSIALGELFLTPALMAFTSKAAPAGAQGIMMGALTLALSMGSLLSGEVTKIPFSTGTTFFLIGVFALGISVLLACGKVTLAAFQKKQII